ncbi:DeoR/GlpR family DNA-binding transcription regulator [uncultured Faecalibaculum sp.]|uniref:DeoR/GlpR family DNA-binding transcription regulator n=1 Tax=uncultured Faecalibaculum sp. TaxID=1729681 RepID=UPI0025E2F187|nr:DeoR/GlpR family DNA-binding transcription regulator [uncultured Faecalibaculum sp.]
MTNAERLDRLASMVRQSEFLSVSQIMNEFGVSRSSAMRDLDELERQGLVIRQRGGAVLKDRSRHLTKIFEPATLEKADMHAVQKAGAARKAADLVQDGDCVFLDSGTTIAKMMKDLGSRDITIVTPNVYLLSQVPENFPGRICLLGGDFDKSYLVSTGPLARQILESFWFDKAFVSANGLADDRAWANDLSVAEIKQDAMKRANTSYLVMDRSKENRRGMYAFAPVQNFAQVITEPDEGHEDTKEEEMKGN